ncbi:MAG: ferrous iron transport protein A [Anaerolineae bacterium]|jgi:ferrous iron transport protein A|nr:ferrous iron transport protein A [Anaerolineae bacterium]
MVPLESLSPGETCFVGALQGGHRFVSRLASLGFTAGAEVTMVRNFGSGPVIVLVRGAQIALGRGEAHHVRVHRSEAGFNASPS